MNNFLPTSIYSIRKRCVLHKNSGAVCSICLQYLNNTTKNKYVTRLPCSHKFHPVCIQRWTKFTCPNCRYLYFFTEYHSVEVERPVTSRATYYPYNDRHKRSFYNVVLYELRQFHYHRLNHTPTPDAYAHASAKVQRLFSTGGVFRYFR